MGRHRSKRTAEEWKSHGHHLLKMLGKKHKLHNEIELLIKKLINNDSNENETTKLLNSYNENLKDYWRKWTQKIKQIPKDAERTKFYIKKSTFEDILKFLCITPEEKLEKGISDQEAFEILFTNLKNLGIRNIDDIIELNDKLNKYAGAASDRFSSDKLTTEIKDNQSKNYIIIHAILNTLKNKEVTTFDKLINIKNIVRNKIIRELEGENEMLRSKIKSLRTKVTELEDKLEPPLDLS